MSPRIAEVSPGVLGNKYLTDLINSECMTSSVDLLANVKESAVDLPLSANAWVLANGERPTPRSLARLISPAAGRHQIGADGAFEFEAEKIYLVELDVNLRLPDNINGRATGKSSVGRLDVITRLVTSDRMREYDVVPPGCGSDAETGKVYLLVAPQTFTIKAKPGESLNQLRLFCGAPRWSAIKKEESLQYPGDFWHVYEGTKLKDWKDVIHYKDDNLTSDPTLFDLTVDLSDKHEGYIYEARERSEVSEPIELSAAKETYDPNGYFRRARIEEHQGDRYVDLKRGRFYIMKSRERLTIPKDVAVEVIAISERIGDIRIHYAGFAHPGFGLHDGERKGTPLIFEVRATDLGTRLYDGSLLARIQVFRTSGPITTEPSFYNKQELQLSKVFKKVPVQERE